MPLSYRYTLLALTLLLSIFLLGPPSPATAQPNNILKAAKQANLTQLVADLNATGGPLLDAAKNWTTAITVFAPTDEVGNTVDL